MLFITSLLIFSFCFVFFVIWNQFLRKDTRLSIGLKILQKKMDVLEDFSEKADIQLRKGVELLDKKNRELERIVNEARFCIFKMEKLITGIENKKPVKMSLVQDKNEESAPLKKKKKPSVPLVSKKFNFGESPFTHLNFVELKKKKSYDPSPSA